MELPWSTVVTTAARWSADCIEHHHRYISTPDATHADTCVPVVLTDRAEAATAGISRPDLDSVQRALDSYGPGMLTAPMGFAVCDAIDRFVAHTPVAQSHYDEAIERHDAAINLECGFGFHAFEPAARLDSPQRWSDEAARTMRAFDQRDPCSPLSGRGRRHVRLWRRRTPRWLTRLWAVRLRAHHWSAGRRDHPEREPAAPMVIGARLDGMARTRTPRSELAVMPAEPKSRRW